jgi:hypothetical protein
VLGEQPGHADDGDDSQEANEFHGR